MKVLLDSRFLQLGGINPSGILGSFGIAGEAGVTG
jgi:hypothetical protein